MGHLSPPPGDAVATAGTGSSDKWWIPKDLSKRLPTAPPARPSLAPEQPAAAAAERRDDAPGFPGEGRAACIPLGPQRQGGQRGARREFTGADPDVTSGSAFRPQGVVGRRKRQASLQVGTCACPHLAVLTGSDCSRLQPHARQEAARQEDAPVPCRRCGRPREWKHVNHVPMHPKDAMLLAKLGVRLVLCKPEHDEELVLLLRDQDAPSTGGATLVFLLLPFPALPPPAPVP